MSIYPPPLYVSTSSPPKKKSKACRRFPIAILFVVLNIYYFQLLSHIFPWNSFSTHISFFIQGFTGLYATMCDKMELKNVFYACVYPFLAFFMMFSLVIYPNRGFLHPHAFVDMLASHLPMGMAAPLSIVRNWSFALFYVMAEMWGSVVTSLLFWGFANEVTTVDEAKKYCECRIVLGCRGPISLF
jgi:TLC ATP/ADP transporter